MNNQATATDMRLTSSVFANMRKMPRKYTCQGQNISPQLSWSGTPDDTESLALIMHDPDAPDGDWLHWSVWNIPADTTSINEASLPVGAVEGQTSFGTSGYGGPCPPSGTHRYVFELYALDTTLTLPAGSERHKVEETIHDHMLAKTKLTGLFSR